MARKNSSVNQLILWGVLFCTIILVIMMFFMPSDERRGDVEKIEASGKASSQQAILPRQTAQNTASTATIDKLTRQDVVVKHLINYQRLPNYYLKKNAARAQGWDARAGDLCDVLPGKAIGGDYFSNREKRLPHKSGRKWYEADINYHCGHRGADRLVYSSDGLIYLTQDHYKSFRLLRGGHE